MLRDRVARPTAREGFVAVSPSLRDLHGVPKRRDTRSALVGLDWTHLWDWNPGLSERSTPDWVLYCEAAFGGFNAIVTRDFTQSEQAEEMVCLSRLHDFHVISWKQRMDDPISEWGQLLAYIPSIRRYMGEHHSRVIFLPVPTLANDRSVHQPKEFIARIAKSRGQSV